jgi:uroporphyrinogen-III decarboxylase
MREETMTPLERVKTVIGLRQADRVPVIPMWDFFAARHVGLTMREFIEDEEKATQAEIQTFIDYGLRDLPFTSNPLTEFAFKITIPLRMKVPGRELPDDAIWQFDEREEMKVDDYDFVIANGWKALWGRLITQIHDVQPQDIGKEIHHWVERSINDIHKWEAMGYACFAGAGISPPFECFAYPRSLHEYALDLRRRPEKVLQAIEAITDEIIQDAVGAFVGSRQASKYGYLCSFIGASRASATFISPKLAEKFYFPSLKKMAEALVAVGSTPLFHHDNNWGPMLEYFKEMPKGKCILEVDGQTDIFQAKKILGDHMCLMGDVPATLFKLGTPQEVEAYCKRLIDEVGEGGGFILSSGCGIPHDAKPENVRAMILTGMNYELSKPERVYA